MQRKDSISTHELRSGRKLTLDNVHQLVSSLPQKITESANEIKVDTIDTPHAIPRHQILSRARTPAASIESPESTEFPELPEEDMFSSSRKHSQTVDFEQPEIKESKELTPKKVMLPIQGLAFRKGTAAGLGFRRKDTFTPGSDAIFNFQKQIGHGAQAVVNLYQRKDGECLLKIESMKSQINHQELHQELCERLRFFSLLYPEKCDSIIAFYKNEKLVSLAIPFFPGTPFADFILQTHIRDNDDLIIKTLTASAQALKKAHDKNLCIIDFKQDNVLCHLQENGEITAYLIDGGYSCLSGEYISTKLLRLLRNITLKQFDQFFWHYPKIFRTSSSYLRAKKWMDIRALKGMFDLSLRCEFNHDSSIKANEKCKTFLNRFPDIKMLIANYLQQSTDNRVTIESVILTLQGLRKRSRSFAFHTASTVNDIEKKLYKIADEAQRDQITSTILALQFTKNFKEKITLNPSIDQNDSNIKLIILWVTSLNEEQLQDLKNNLKGEW